MVWSGNGISVQSYMMNVFCFNPIAVSLWGSVTPWEKVSYVWVWGCGDLSSYPVYTPSLHVLCALIPLASLCLLRPRFRKYVCVLRNCRANRTWVWEPCGNLGAVVQLTTGGHFILLSPGVDFCRSLLVRRDFTEGEERKQMWNQCLLHFKK